MVPTVWVTSILFPGLVYCLSFKLTKWEKINFRSCFSISFLHTACNCVYLCKHKQKEVDVVDLTRPLKIVRCVLAVKQISEHLASQ